jgi:hypothetical protein
MTCNSKQHILNMETTNMKKYQIFYRAFIPSYRDIDHDDIIIEAVDEQDAIRQFHELVKYVNRYEIKLIENDSVK